MLYVFVVHTGKVKLLISNHIANPLYNKSIIFQMSHWMSHLGHPPGRGPPLACKLSVLVSRCCPSFLIRLLGIIAKSHAEFIFFVGNSYCVFIHKTVLVRVLVVYYFSDIPLHVTFGTEHRFAIDRKVGMAHVFENRTMSNAHEWL